MMKKLLTLTLTLLVSLSFGQTAIKKENISTDGGSQTNGSTTVVYTVGEIAIQENSNGTIHLSEGFIGPDIAEAMDIKDYTLLQNINIYPNPTQDFVNINFENESEYQINVTDLSGKIIYTFEENNQLEQRINLQNLKVGVYLLVIKDVKFKKYKIFKIVKK
jgi:hypothetical protein